MWDNINNSKGWYHENKSLKSLEEWRLLIKGVTETIENEAKE